MTALHARPRTWQWQLGPLLALVILLLATTRAGADAPSSSATTLLAEARRLYAEEGPRAALPGFEQARDAYRAEGDRLGEAIVLGYLGNCRKHFGEYEAALELLDQALTMKRDLGDRLEEAKTLNHLGLVHWEMAAYDRAVARFDESLVIARALDDSRIEAALLNNIGLVLDERGEHRAALARYREALEVQRELGDRSGEGATTGNIGGSQFALGEFRAAVASYEQSLAISRELGHKPSESQDLGNLGLCRLWLDETEAALAHLEDALLLAREAGLAKEEADWLRFRGSAQLRRGHHSAALADHRAALAIYRSAGMKRERVEGRLDLAHVYLEVGDAQSCREEAEAALALADAIGFMRGKAQAEMLLADLARRLDRPEEALGRYRRARALAGELGDEALEALLLLQIGGAMSEAGQLEPAAKQLERARGLAARLGMKTHQSLALYRLAMVDRKLGQTDQALERLDAGLALAEEIHNPSVVWQLQHGRGRALEQADRKDEALAAYRAAVDAVEEIRGRLGDEHLRAGYVEDKAEVYRDLVSLLLKMGKLGAALSYVERSRARAYLDLLGSERPAAWADGDTERHREEHALRKKIQHLSGQLERAGSAERSGAPRAVPASSLIAELAAARRSYSTVLRQLRAADPQFTSLLVVEPLAASDVRSLLGPGEALLEYFLTGEEMVLFVVTQEAVNHVQRPVTTRKLAAKVQLLRDRLRPSGSGDTWQGPAASLHEVLLTPAEEAGLLDGITSLQIVPHGVLHYLPFALLQRAGRHLVERYDLAYLPSASTLRFCRDRRGHADRRLLAMAPAATGLRHAAEEARVVSELFAAGGRALIGGEATERFCKRHCGDYGLLHFATHGELDPLNPLFSQIALEAGENEDGRLEVHEIMGLDLTAELVTLSACETGLGSGYFSEIPAGDDWVGLTRAFLYAGTPAVVATLWSVDDRSTTQLMRRFYGHLRDSGGATALARAQRDVLAAAADRGQPADPFRWAAFVLVGDGR